MWKEAFPKWKDTQSGVEHNPANGRIAVTDEWLSLLTPSIDRPETVVTNDNKPISTIESILFNTRLGTQVSPFDSLTVTESWDRDDQNGISRSSLLETIICGVFEDGLTRVGSHLLFDNHPSDPNPLSWKVLSLNMSKSFNTNILKGQPALEKPATSHTTLRITFKISGFAYSGSWASYLAMSVLLIHVVFALGHTIWVLSTRRSSDS